MSIGPSPEKSPTGSDPEESEKSDDQLEQTSVDLEQDKYFNGDDTGREHKLESARENLDKATLEKLEDKKSDKEEANNKKED
jgi:hypothetical protein